MKDNMTNNFGKMLVIGAMAGLIGLGTAMPAYASTTTIATSDACMIKLQTNDGPQHVNVAYIKLLYIHPSSKDTVRVNLGAEIAIKYGTPSIAEKSMDAIADKITYCRQKATERMNASRVEQPSQIKPK